MEIKVPILQPGIPPNKKALPGKDFSPEGFRGEMTTTGEGLGFRLLPVL